MGRLRGVYVAERDCDAAAATCQREAFVDLSAEARNRHTGGALDELFTIYAIVNAVTINLPAISRVHILVDGKWWTRRSTMAGQRVYFLAVDEDLHARDRRQVDRSRRSRSRRS